MGTHFVQQGSNDSIAEITLATVPMLMVGTLLWQAHYPIS
jgi:hypothetical protein